MILNASPIENDHGVCTLFHNFFIPKDAAVTCKIEINCFLRLNDISILIFFNSFVYL